jgi:hypothetical protein
MSLNNLNRGYGRFFANRDLKVFLKLFGALNTEPQTPGDNMLLLSTQKTDFEVFSIISLA